MGKAALFIDSQVYPRVGGGTTANKPRQKCRGGSIPAWAGEPVAMLDNLGGPEVYPRVGGGTPQRLFVPVP